MTDRKWVFNARFALVITLILLVAFAAGCAAPCISQAAGAPAYIVIEAESGRVIAEERADAKMYPASTTKILTALVVLERMPLELEFTVPDCAVGVEGSSIYLRRGEKVSVGDMLYGLMLRSGNDAAVALAVATAGSVERFAAMMNERARRAGAVNSNFVNPHGLHDDEHYTTARDLALITAEAYRHPEFARIAATKKVTTGEGENARKVTTGEGENARVMYNKNKLLSSLEGANGVKTGYTTRSGKCLVGGAVVDGVQRISVLLGASGDMWSVTRELLTKKV